MALKLALGGTGRFQAHSLIYCEYWALIGSPWHPCPAPPAEATSQVREVSITQKALHCIQRCKLN